MLKNVLEANGYNIIVNFINTNNIGSHYFYEIRKGFNLDTTRHIKYISKEENIEEACKQYVRENGFKLEWFDFTHYEKMKSDVENCFLLAFAKQYKYLSTLVVYENKIKELPYHFNELDIRLKKLIAWLYSEDIKIVEE